MPVLIVFGVLLLLAGLYLFMLAPGKRRDTRPFDETKFAHRGLHTSDSRVPENSLAAFRLAKEAGYGVELDIQFTADRQIVVFHDATLKRMCGVDGRVDQFTYAQLDQFRLLDSDQHIPLLIEALEALGDAPLVCEIKSHGAVGNTSLCAAAWPLLQAHTGPWCIESFNPLMVRWFRQHHPEVIRGILSKSYIKQDGLPLWQRWLLGSLSSNLLTRPDFIAFDHDSSNNLGFRLCRALFRPLCIAWTVRSQEEEQRAMARFDTVIFERYKPKK